MRDDKLPTAAAAWIAAARTAWPQIVLDEAGFVAQVLTRLPETASLDHMLAVHAGDLWIAAACAAGDSVAIAAFDARFLAPLRSVLSTLSVDQVEEVQQELRRKLLVADGGPPRISEYSGRADLRTWIRTAAIRTSIDLIRRQRDLPVEDEEFAALPAIDDDPELAHLKQRYRSEFPAAITAAVAQLAPRDRLVLKYHYVDGFGIDRIAAIYQVHRSSAARWLGAAREELADRVHVLLISQLGVGSAELRSIARLVESQLDLSVRQLLD